MNRTYNENQAYCILHGEMKAYESGRRLKPNERKSLREWVAEGNSVFRNPFYVYDSEGNHVDYISAYRQCIKEYKINLRRELKEYEQTFTDLTDEERNELHEWVTDGNSVYDNPYLIVYDGGRPVDYIEAIRTIEDLRNNPEYYNCDCDNDF